MITYKVGDVFLANTQTIVNPINTEGAMGAGLALLFRNKFPGLFNDYLNKHKNKELEIGKLYVWKESTPWVLNFPTKKEWKLPSQLEYIRKGLDYFIEHYIEMGITSIAFPALGCGLGGLPMAKVFQLMETKLSKIEIPCFIYREHT